MEHQRKTLMSVSTLINEELRASYTDAATFPHSWLDHLQAVPWPLVRRLGALLTTPEFYNVAPGIDAPEEGLDLRITSFRSSCRDPLH